MNIEQLGILKDWPFAKR